MGTYLNCGNEAFRRICGDRYVDKTGLIDYVNNKIDTADNLICFSRPRRFGKSYAAMMLAAYYDRSCDSRALFDGLEISKSETYEKYINSLDVIYLDITWFISLASERQNIVNDIQSGVIHELREAFPGCVRDGETILQRALIDVNQSTGESFFMIIDEWDALFREAKDDQELQKEYIQLLRGLFKGGPAMKSAIAGAYMTGILPIKKYGTESALTDFQEFTMTNPGPLAGYVGFTEPEVRKLCEKSHMDFDRMSAWYDGYSFSRIQHVYSPNSVMKAVINEEFDNYWTLSETYESLRRYIGMNFDGLKDAIITMLGGNSVKVKISTFQNDITSFRNKDDVLTLLIHLGYLGYHAKDRSAFIPNQEVADAFADAVEGDEWEEIGQLIRESEDLLAATIRCDSEAVAEALERAHSANSSVLRYNDENSLSCAVMIAYYTAKRYYKIVREFPEGKGFADLVFLPGKGMDMPAMVVELKYDQDADGAIRQIHENRYEGDLKKYFGNLLLVGISYNKKAKGRTAKQHSCVIEKL